MPRSACRPGVCILGDWLLAQRFWLAWAGSPAIWSVDLTRPLPLRHNGCRHAGLKAYAKLSSPDQLPEVLPMATCGQRFKIPPDDPRAALAADPGELVTTWLVSLLPHGLFIKSNR